MLTLSRVDTWVATVDDRAGALRDTLAHLATAGVNLEFLIARRAGESPGKGLVFVAPVLNDVQMAQAEKAGFKPAEGLHSLRVTGTNEPGMGYLVANALAAEGINLRGVSAAALGQEFVMYLAFDTERDAANAARRLRQAL